MMQYTRLVVFTHCWVWNFANHGIWEGPFTLEKDTKLTLFKDHDTCRGGCNHCGEGVILDQSYFFTHEMLESCRSFN